MDVQNADASGFVCARCRHAYRDEERVAMPGGEGVCELCADEIRDRETDAYRGFVGLLNQSMTSKNA